MNRSHNSRTDWPVKNQESVQHRRKWLLRLINKEGVWQNLLRRKYLSNKSLTQVQHRPRDSYFWAGLMKAKEDFLACGTFKV